MDSEKPCSFFQLVDHGTDVLAADLGFGNLTQAVAAEYLFQFILIVHRIFAQGQDAGNRCPEESADQRTLHQRVAEAEGIHGNGRNTGFIQKDQFGGAHHKFSNFRIIGQYRFQHLLGPLRVRIRYLQGKDIGGCVGGDAEAGQVAQFQVAHDPLPQHITSEDVGEGLCYLVGSSGIVAADAGKQRVGYPDGKGSGGLVNRGIAHPLEARQTHSAYQDQDQTQNQKPFGFPEEVINQDKQIQLLTVVVRMIHRAHLPFFPDLP